LAAGKATWNIWCNSLSPAGIIPVAGFDLRPSKEPPRIATGGSRSVFHRRGMGDAVPAFLPPQTEVKRFEVTAIFHHRRML